MTQLPPFSKFETDFQKLEAFLGMTNPKIRYAIEFRNKSWLRDETFELFVEKEGVFCLECYRADGRASPKVDVRFHLPSVHGKVWRIQEIQQGAEGQVRSSWRNGGIILSEKIGSVNLALVLVSNHFSGFAPATVNELRN